MKEPIRILHLSDLHFRKEKEGEIQAVLMGLGDSVAKMVREERRPDFIAFPKPGEEFLCIGLIRWSAFAKDSIISGVLSLLLSLTKISS